MDDRETTLSDGDIVTEPISPTALLDDGEGDVTDTDVGDSDTDDTDSDDQDADVDDV